MLKERVSLRVVLLGCLLGIAVNTLWLFLWTVLIRQQIIDMSFVRILIIGTLSVSCLSAGIFTCVQSGNAVNSIVAGCVLYVLLLVSAIGGGHGEIAISYCIQNFFAVVLGDFFGIIFGMRKHNRLRKIRKKKS